MTRRKLALMAALVVPSMALVALPGSASASRAPAPTGTGSVTCSVGGGVGFDPPMNEYGTPKGDGAKTETVDITLLLTNCTGPDSNTPQPNPTTSTVTFRTHLKDTPVEFMGHIMNVLGGCGYGDFDPDASGKGAATWTGGSRVAKTHTKLEVDTMIGLDVGGGSGDVTGTTTGSYAGTVSATLNPTADSADEYNTICNGDGGDAGFSSLQFDPSTSTITFGSS